MKYRGYEIEIISGQFMGDNGDECYDFEFVGDDLCVYTSDVQFFHRSDCEIAAKHYIDKLEDSQIRLDT